VALKTLPSGNHFLTGISPVSALLAEPGFFLIVHFPAKYLYYQAGRLFTLKQRPPVRFAMIHTSQKQEGNALFLILIAVALFAALSYAVTQSGRGGGSSNKEMAQLDAARIVQYGGELQQAISRLMLINGCTDRTLNFINSSWVHPYAYDSSLTPVDGSCDVFGQNGGGATWQAPPASVVSATGMAEWTISGVFQIIGVGQDETSPGVVVPEITLIGYVTQDICNAVNTKEGISSMPSLAYTHRLPSSVDWNDWMAFGQETINVGGDIYGNHMRFGDGDSPTLAGHAMGCLYDTTHSQYIMYIVLLVR
jgi:hypothetical protein